MPGLPQRLVSVLGAVLPVEQEPDGALTVRHDGTFASLRVVTVADGLDLISLSQMLVWDMPLDRQIRARVARHARNTMLGTVTLMEKRVQKKSQADVLLRYNFPAAGLSDDALQTLVLMVLSVGVDIRRDLAA